jgi:hypothetical protein
MAVRPTVHPGNDKAIPVARKGIMELNYRTDDRDARWDRWEQRYARPADDIRDLRSQLRDGTVDFRAMEMAS